MAMRRSYAEVLKGTAITRKSDDILPVYHGLFPASQVDEYGPRLEYAGPFNVKKQRRVTFMEAELQETPEYDFLPTHAPSMWDMHTARPISDNFFYATNCGSSFWRQTDQGDDLLPDQCNNFFERFDNITDDLDIQEASQDTSESSKHHDQGAKLPSGPWPWSGHTLSRVFNAADKHHQETPPSLYSGSTMSRGSKGSLASTYDSSVAPKLHWLVEADLPEDELEKDQIEARLTRSWAEIVRDRYFTFSAVEETLESEPVNEGREVDGEDEVSVIIGKERPHAGFSPVPVSEPTILLPMSYADIVRGVASSPPVKKSSCGNEVSFKLVQGHKVRHQNGSKTSDKAREVRDVLPSPKAECTSTFSGEPEAHDHNRQGQEHGQHPGGLQRPTEPSVQLLDSTGKIQVTSTWYQPPNGANAPQAAVLSSTYSSAPVFENQCASHVEERWDRYFSDQKFVGAREVETCRNTEEQSTLRSHVQSKKRGTLSTEEKCTNVQESEPLMTHGKEGKEKGESRTLQARHVEAFNQDIPREPNFAVESPRFDSRVTKRTRPHFSFNKGNTMQHSISRMVFLETELSRMRLEPILEDCDEDDTDSLPEQTQLNKEPIESESTLPEVPCPIDDYSTNSNEPSQTDASNILGKLVELPGDNARMQTWLQHLSVRVHGNDPPSSNSAHVGWQTSETQAALSTSGRSSTSKRARKPDSDDEDDNETGGSGRRRKQIPGSGETLIGLLACPFAKFDPLKHVLCWTYADPNTSRLRQHLRSKHYPPVHCPKCAKVFSGARRNAARDEHIREVVCEKVNLDNRWDMTEDQRRDVEASSSRSLDSEQYWHQIFGILFPHFPQQRSPYAEDFSALALRMHQENILRQCELQIERMASEMSQMTVSANSSSNLEFLRSTMPSILQQAFQAVGSSPSSCQGNAATLFCGSQGPLHTTGTLSDSGFADSSTVSSTSEFAAGNKPEAYTASSRVEILGRVLENDALFTPGGEMAAVVNDDDFEPLLSCSVATTGAEDLENFDLWSF